MDSKRVLVGKSVTVRSPDVEPKYFTDVHRARVGQTGRVHAVVAGDRDDPLVKVGFEEGTQIVFYRLADLSVDHEAEPETPKRHGVRASHLPKLD